MLSLTLMFDQLRPSQIAFQLHKPEYDVAFVEFRDQVFYSYYPKGVSAPSSAVIKLLHGLFDHFIDQSFFILRQRVYTTASTSAKCLGMIKVVAKRCTFDVLAQDNGVEVAVKFIEISDKDILVPSSRHLSEANALALSFLQSPLANPPPNREDLWMQVLQKIAKIPARGEVLHDFDRGIAALMLSTDGEVLSYGVNSNSKNKTLHAEVNMIFRYFRDTGSKIPNGAIIYSTHKPCKMCAGLIYDWAEKSNNISVIYQTEEKGSLSRHTVLDQIAVNRVVLCP